MRQVLMQQRIFVCFLLFAFVFFAAKISVEKNFAAENGDSKNAEKIVAEKSSADSAKTDSTKTDSVKTETAPLLVILQSGGMIGIVLFGLSLTAFALTLEHFLTIRPARVVPKDFAREVHDILATGNWLRARERCQKDKSVLAAVLAAGLNECELGWHDVERGVNEAVAEHAARLYRKVEYLNVIGNIAPMLGLLGTVIGMMMAFRHLADTQGFSRAAELADGIYLALVTTVEGLLVAIPSLAFYAILCNRIAHLMTETTTAAEQTLLPLKRAFLMKKRGS